MRPVRPVWFLVALFLAAPLLAGCMGDTEAPPEPPTEDPAPDAASDPAARGGPGLVAADREIDLAPWLQDLGPVREAPNLRRLGQVDWAKTDFGAFRLLSDGQSFVLVVDAREAALPEDAVVLARVHDAETDYTLGRGVAAVVAAGQTVLELPSHDIVRFGNRYAYEVYVVVPESPETLATLQERPRDLGVVNVTLLHSWRDMVQTRPGWALTFEGPGEGTDRPDLVEKDLLADPDTGRYTFTFTGTRVWLAEVVFDFGRSKVAGTQPHVDGNGSTTLRIGLDGWQSLDAYLEMTPGKGLEQSFTLDVQVDYETQDDLPGEEDQYFFVTATIGYRHGGSTYVADTDGRDLLVHVTGSP